jgi:branched-chain amino acid transport system permease protein
METLIQQFINGLVIGSVYALIALGYTMVYGILGLINFAHGDVLMVGALVALQTMLFLMGMAPGMSPLVMLAIALAVAMVICMLLGFTMERLAYRRLRNAPRLAPLITAIGVSFLLQTLAMIIWGRNYHTFPQLISTTPLQPIPACSSPRADRHRGGVGAADGRPAAARQSHRIGRAMRATAENHRVASLMGVDTNAVIAPHLRHRCRARRRVAGVMFASNYGNRPLRHGLQCRASRALHRRGAGRHRQPRWRDARRRRARAGGVLRRGLHRAPHLRLPQLVLPGHLRLHHPRPGADLPAHRTARRTRVGPGLSEHAP